MAKGKIIIIGATSGIGKELALLYAQKGYIVGISGRRKNLLNEIQKIYPNNIIYRSWDISKDNNSEELNKLIEKIGGLDLLILNAGVSAFNKTLDFEINRKAIMTNVLGFTEIMDFAYKFFEKQEYGHLAAVTSAAGLRGYANAPAYHASKSYQMIYLESLRNKAFKDQKNIQITDIRPGFVDTDMTKDKTKFFSASAGQAAKSIYNALQEERNTVYVPYKWRILTEIWKIAPVWSY